MATFPLTRVMTALLILGVLLLIDTSRLFSASPQETIVPPPEAASSNLSLDELRRGANQYWSKGEILTAVDYYRAILDRVDVPGKSDLLSAADLYGMGSLSIELGHLDDAKQYYERSLEMFQRLGQNTGAGQVYQAIGGLMQLQGAFSAAESALKKAVALLNKYAGPSDLRTARAWSALAWCYTSLERFDEATEAMRKARTAADKAVPANSPAFIQILDSQASLLSRTGRYADAQRAWTQAIEIAERAVGKDSPEYDYPLLHLAQTDSAIGDYESAQKLFERFLAIERRVVPQGSIPQAVTMAQLGKVYVRLGEYPNAESLLIKSVYLMDTIPDKVPLAYAEVLSYLGNYWAAQRRWSDAENPYRGALEMRQQVLGNNHLVAQSMASLSEVLEKLKRKDEAKKLKTQAEEIMAAQRSAFYNHDTVDITAFRAK